MKEQFSKITPSLLAIIVAVGLSYGGYFTGKKQGEELGMQKSSIALLQKIEVRNEQINSLAKVILTKRNQITIRDMVIDSLSDINTLTMDSISENLASFRDLSEEEQTEIEHEALNYLLTNP